MNLLDQKIEEKLKLLEEYDKLFSNYQTKISPLDISHSTKKNLNTSKDLNTTQKRKGEKNIEENNKFDNIYSNFDLNKNENAFYFRNYEEMMNYMYTLKSKVLSNPEKNKKVKNNQKSQNFGNKKYNKNNNEKYKIHLIPKKDYLIDRLLRYGENLEKKKERMKLEIEKNFKIMANPNISDTAKKINRNPNKFVERLFYDKYSNDKKKYNKNNSYYYNNKKDEKKKKSSEKKNFSYRPTINKKSQDIANKLEPSSKRLLRKKEKKELIDKEECEKLAFENYKNLFINNNYFNKYENKKVNFNEKNLIYKLYNKGLENLKNKEMKFQENIRKKNEEYKNYSFSPNASINNSKKKIKKIKNEPKVKNIKYLNNNMYSKQIEWQKKKNLENSKKKLLQENLYISNYCTFKPEINYEKIKDDEQIIKRNLKTSNSYIEKRRKQIEQKQENLNKSSDNKKYGFSIKDFLSDENNSYIYGDKVINTTSRYNNYKKINNKKLLFCENNKNSMSIVIPPYSQRIFCYYNENGDLNNSLKYNNFSSVDYSQINFIDAINALHNELDSLVI